MFVVHAMRRKKLIRKLLEFANPRPGFSKHASHFECVQAIYHSHPCQLFRELNEEKAAHAAFKLALEDLHPNFTPPPPAKLFIDFLKDRLAAGVIFSLPKWVFPPGAHEREAIVPADAFPPPFDPATVVPECLAVVVSMDFAIVPKIGMAFREHRFFQVIKSSVAGRFLQHDTDGKSMCLVATELRLGGRTGDAAVFGQDDIGTVAVHVNLFRLLQRAGARALLEG